MKKIIASALTALMLLICLDTSARTEVRKKQSNAEKSGLALQGYDLLADFTESKTIKGKKDYAVLADGATYNFSITQNRDLFKVNFAKYEPK